MDEDRQTNRAPMGPVPAFRQSRQSVWPLTIGAVLLILLAVAAVMSLLTDKKLEEPWRIGYPGITVLGGEDEYYEGQRRLRIAVRFEKDVVSAQDVETYLAELVNKTGHVYAYYHVKILNRRLVHVLDAVTDRHGTHSLTPTADYHRQGAAGRIEDTGDDSAVVGKDPQREAPGTKHPWEFDYPGVTWLSGKPDATEEGRRHLKVSIRFDKHVVFVHDLDAFLDAFLARQKRAYPYYVVKVFNLQRVHVLDAVADDSGKRRVIRTEHFANQKDPDAPEVEITVD